MKSKLITILLIFFLFGKTFAQVYTDKVVGAKNEELIDSLKTTDYPYLLPIWGAKVVEKGFDIPYSAGVSTNYFTQTSALILDNLLVGFNNGPMYNLDEIIRFNEAEAWASAVTVRPDIWLFPFLNVYGLLGKGKSSTTIDAGVYLPDIDNEWTQVTSIKTKADFSGTTMGIGMTPTIGIGGGWLEINFFKCILSNIGNPKIAG